jgi:hypothetical protein
LAKVGIGKRHAKDAKKRNCQSAGNVVRLNAALDMPPIRPKLTQFEAWANMGMAILLLGAGGSFTWVIFRAPLIAATNSSLPFASLLLASGVALVILGYKTLKLLG